MDQIDPLKKPNGNDELNSLFEKLIASREKGIRSIEELKGRMTAKLDLEISRLYAKKDLIADMWVRREELRLQKISVLKKIIRNSLAKNLRFLVASPFIYAMVVPTLVMHITLELYHNVCFRLYGIPLVRARDYFIFDRQLLPYLNWLEKINCFYCSYYNCLVSYMKEIGGRTERFWCPIKHSKALKDQHSQYDSFVDYADGDALRKKWDDLRKFDDDTEKNNAV